MQLIEDLCKRIELEDLNLNEKIAMSYAFDENFDKFKAGVLLEKLSSYSHR